MLKTDALCRQHAVLLLNYWGGINLEYLHRHSLSNSCLSLCPSALHGRDHRRSIRRAPQEIHSPSSGRGQEDILFRTKALRHRV